MEGLNINYIIFQQSKDTIIYNTTSKLMFFSLIIPERNSWGATQARSLSRRVFVISGQDPLPVVLNCEFLIVLHVELEGQVQKQQTIEIQQLKTKHHIKCHTSGFKELCSILTVWNFAENRKERLGTYLLVPTHCSVKITFWKQNSPNLRIMVCKFGLHC